MPAVGQAQIESLRTSLPPSHFCPTLTCKFGLTPNARCKMSGPTEEPPVAGVLLYRTSSTPLDIVTNHK
jgi:hypothetical protein